MTRKRTEGAAEGEPGIADRLHSLAIRVLRSVRPADAEAGMSAARLSALSVLVFGGARSIGELAESEQVSAPTMTRLVQGLERDGYVQRRRNPADGRGIVVEALPAAGRALRAGRARRVALLELRLSSLNRAERDLLEQALAVLEPLFGRGREAPGEGRGGAASQKVAATTRRIPRK